MFSFDHPNSSQLKKINRYRPAGTPEYTSEEIYTVAIAATNNILSHSNMVWGENSLKVMTKAFLGQDFLLNHSWEDAKQSIGFIYDSQRINTPNPPPWYLDGLDSVQKQSSRKIVKQQGYSTIILYAAIEASHPAVSMILYGRSKDVSIGGLANGDYICPLCQTSFKDEDCPHLPPHPFLLMWLADDEDANFAPYYINDGFYDGIELSVVVDGNCAAARVISQADLEYFEKLEVRG